MQRPLIQREQLGRCGNAILFFFFMPFRIWMWLQFRRIENAHFKRKQCERSYILCQIYSKTCRHKMSRCKNLFAFISFVEWKQFFDKLNSMEPVAVEKCVVFFARFSACDYIKMDQLFDGVLILSVHWNVDVTARHKTYGLSTVACGLKTITYKLTCNN